MTSELMEIEDGGEDVEVSAVWDRKIDPQALERKFRGQIGEFEAPANSEGDNYILENLTLWNRALSRIGYALDEIEPGKALLRPMKTFLRLSGEDFVELGFYLLYRLLKCHTCVKSLEIGDHLSFIQYASLINAALSGSSSLESLEVVVVPEDPKCGEPLVKGIASLTTLEHLTLKNFVLSSRSNKLLSGSLKSTGCLKTLRLNSVETAVEDLLRNAGPGLQNLTELAITNRPISKEVAEAIASILSTCNNIAKLDLSRSGEINDKVLEVICKALASNQSLQVVDFNETRISSGGCVCLAEALKQNTSIRVFHFEIDQVDDNGVKAIAHMIGSNNTLQVLNWQFGFREISEEGALALAEAIAVSSALLELNLCLVYVNFEGSKLIIDGLSRNTTLKELGFANSFEMEKHEREALATLIKSRNLFGRLQMNFSVEEAYAQASVIPTSDKIQKVFVTWKEDSTGEEIKALLEAVRDSGSVVELKVDDANKVQTAIPALAALLKTTKTLKKVEIPIMARQRSSFDLVMGALAENESITELNLYCEMLDGHAEQSLGNMLKRNRCIHTLIMDDVFTEFSISTDPPHTILADCLESNWTLLSLTNSYAWIPSDGLFRIEEVLRRNRQLLHRASAFALCPLADEKAARDFQVLAHADSLVENIAKVAEKSVSEAREIVAKAQVFVKHHFQHL